MKTTTLITTLLLALAANVACAGPKASHYYHKKNKAFSFALIGDVPYGVPAGSEYLPYDNMVEEINADKDIRWVLHAGDIKSGSSECSDELFYDRKKRFNQFKRPLILTLGDNEWTDCHRVRAGEYQPLERLAKLREIFYSKPGKTLGKRKKWVRTQAWLDGFEEFPENVMWSKSNVVFSAIHIVGSDNGLKAFDANGSAVRTVADDEEVARRTEAAIYWLHKAFDQAERRNAAGVFIMIHANPDLEKLYLESAERDENGRLLRTGFREFLIEFATRSKEFGKPVIMAHGDSHYFRLDKPKLPVNLTDADAFLPNFTRVETFGSSNVHWIKVLVDPKSDEVFQFSQQLVEGNM